MTPIISRHKQLIDEQAMCNVRALSRSGDEAEDNRRLAWEISFAMTTVSWNSLGLAMWRIHHPACHDHGLRHCPLCVRPYDPRHDIEAPAVQ